MRKILTILLTFLTVLLFGQDIKPISPLFKNLQSPSFSFMIGRNVWIYKGSAFNPNPWTELAGWKNVKDTLNYYVPYRNAHDTLITSYPIKTPQLILDTTHIHTGEEKKGTLAWDESTQSVETHISSELHLNNGEELWVPLCVNNSGADILNGQPVYINSASSSDPTIRLASNVTYDESRLIGVATQDIPNGTKGRVTRFGYVNDIDLSSCTSGSNVYLGDKVLTHVRPTGGTFPVVVGKAIVCTTTGRLLVYPQGVEYTSEVNKVDGWPSYLQGEQTTLSFSDVNRTLSIISVNPTFYFYQAGIKYIKTGTQTFQISDVEGLHYIYYNLGVFGELVNPSAAQITEGIRNYASVSVIYWDATNKTAIYVGNERHTFHWPFWVRAFIHTSFWTQYLSGLGLTNITLGGGAVNADAQFGVDAGSIADEDVITSTPSIASITGLPIYYRSGAGVWRKTSRAGYSFLNDGITGLAQYNLFAGGTWSLVSMANNYYRLVHVFANNSLTDNVFCVSGVAQYASATDAENGINAEINNIYSGALPFAEAKLIGCLILHTKTGLGNSVNARFVAIPSTNTAYKDFRKSAIQGYGGGGSGSLTFLGLSDTPDSYAGQASKIIGASSLENGVEFKAATIDNNGSINIPAGQTYKINGVTLSKSDIGLGNVTNDAQVKRTEMGANNGVATLDAGGKVPFTQLPASLMIYKGTWSALTNTPTLADGVGTAGWVYKNNLAGTVNFGSGPISFYAGDWVIYNGSTWERSVGTDNVVSVNGQQGIVVLNTSHITENTNLYFTDARAQTAVVEDQINDGVTNKAPSENVVFDALAGKAPASGGTAYIWNQIDNPQNANMWINGEVRSGLFFRLYDSSANPLAGIFQHKDLIGSGTDSGVNLFSYSNVLKLSAANPAAYVSINSDGSVQATTAKLTNLTDGYIPYHISDASGLGDSKIYQSPTNLTIGSGEDFKTVIDAGGYYETLQLKNTSGYNALLFTNNGTTSYISNNGTSLQLSAGVETWNNPHLSINSSGNVGIGYSIGTEITNNKLAVNGSAYFNGNLSASGELQSSSSIRYNGYAFSSNEFRFMLYDGSWYQNIIANQGIFQSTVKTEDYFESNKGLVFKVGGFAASNLRWDVEAGGAETGGNTGSDYGIYRYSDTGAYLGQAFSISRASGNIYLCGTDGNVGIGTSNPTQKLTVFGNYTNPSLNPDSDALASFRVAGHVQLAINAQLGSPYTISLQAKHNNASDTAFPIALNPLGGNVGIGKINPESKLHIDAGNTGVGLTFESSAWTGRKVQMGIDINAAFNIQETSGVSRLSIIPNGNIGIGTTTPISYANKTNLAIQGAWGGQLDIMVGSLSHAQFGTDNYDSGLSARIQSMDGIVFKTNGNTEKVRITSDGNVGIGYSTGTEITNNKLAVNGSGYFNGNIESNTNSNDAAKLILTSYRDALSNSHNWHISSESSGYNYDFTVSNAENLNNKIFTIHRSGASEFSGTVNSTGYLLNGNNLFSSLSPNVNVKWDGTKFVNAATNASGFLKNDGSGNFSYTYPEITSLFSTGSPLGYIATSNGSGGIEMRTPPLNITSFIKSKSSTGIFNLAHSSVVYNNMLFVGERAANPKIVKFSNINDLSVYSSITISGVGSAGAGLETGFYVSSIGKVCFIGRNNTAGFDIIEVDPNTMAYTQHNFSSITGLSGIGGTDGTYIYYSNYSTMYKIRVSDWAIVASNPLPANLQWPHSISVNPARGEFYMTGSIIDPIYMIKVNTSDLSYTQINLSSYITHATDDMCFYDNGTVCKVFVGGEQFYGTEPYCGVVVETTNGNALSPIHIKPSYGLFIDGVKIYSASLDGYIQTFSALDPTNVSTFVLEGYAPNEVLATSTGRTFLTHWNATNSVLAEFYVPVPMPDPTSAVTSVFGRTGAVVAVSGDYTAAQVTNAADKSTSNVFADNITISKSSSPYFEAANTGASTTGGGFRVSDESGFYRGTWGYNNNTNETYFYNQFNDPYKYILNNVEQFRMNTSGVLETRNLSSAPTAARSGFGGFYTKNNLPYFINSSGTETQLGSASGSMVYPSNSGLAVVSGGVAWGTTIAIPGNTTQFLRADGIFATPTFTSQWITDTYGITYANNVGVGVASNQNVKQTILSSTSGYPVLAAQNTSTTGHGVYIYGGNTVNESALKVFNYAGGTTLFDVKGNGNLFMNGITNLATSYGLFYNPTTKEVSYGAASGGGGSGTVTSFSAGGLSPLFTTSVSNATTTPALSFSAVAQAANLVAASPNGLTGTLTFRKLVPIDISGADSNENTVSFYREDGSWISGKPYSSSTTIDCNIYVNSKHSISTNTTITLSNVLEGRTGNIEVTYSGASVITFAVNSSYTLYISSNIYGATTNAYTKSVTSKSSGVATYSYYVSGTNVYIQGNQNWN